MALSASLFLRQNQSLAMTPQLMQSIQLLQMTHLELTQFIAQEWEKNPLLDMVSEADEPVADYPSHNDGEIAHDMTLGNDSPVGDHDWLENGHTPPEHQALDVDFSNVFPDDQVSSRADAPELLSQWKSMPGGLGETAEGYDLDDFAAGQVSLRDHLNQQIPFIATTPQDRLIASALVDQLDEAGYIAAGLGDVAARTGAAPADVEAILARLQSLDPPGLFARSLAECLAIQLTAKDRFDPAMQALVGNLELLAQRDFTTLKRLCGVDEEDLIGMLAEIRSLDPKPASQFIHYASESIIPDVVVRPAPDGSWHVELNPDALPRVLVNHDYYRLVAKHAARNSPEQNFLSQCMHNASWLTRSLDQRARTILKVAVEIVRQQDGFLLHGVNELRPLTLRAVADAIKMHESTVSRVTTNKYMMTPRGLFELKYFFTVSIGSSEGGENHSAEAVRNRIKMMIAHETAEAVLSDDDIVDLLKVHGVGLARRTVAKYREAMNIASSVQRRREKRAHAKAACLA